MLDFIVEILMQIVIEVFADGLSSQGKRRNPERETSPLMTVVLYAIVGVLTAALSILFFPHPFIHSSTGRLLNLILTPLGMGLLMAFIGAIRHGDGLRLQRFACAYALSFSFSLTRFIAASYVN